VRATVGRFKGSGRSRRLCGQAHRAMNVTIRRKANRLMPKVSLDQVDVATGSQEYGDVVGFSPLSNSGKTNLQSDRWFRSSCGCQTGADG
jgi:hypothetical protein